MKVAVVGLARRVIERALVRHGFKLDRKSPHLVISWGGEGTVLYSERLYPGIPKLVIKHERECARCAEHDFARIFRPLQAGRYQVVELLKVEGVVEADPARGLLGMNEINIHHGIPTQAIRFDVWVDDTPIATHVIGDGVIISTPRGSGGYFSSITRRTFAQGLGIAFNNPKRAIGPHLVSENSLIRVKILRGPALLCADNDRKTFRLTEGDQVAIRKSDQVARLIEMDGLRQIDWRSTKPAKRS